jgi:hypothetical protein
VGRRVLLAALLLITFLPRAHASLTVLIGEPFGSFGTMMPVGHATIFLDRVCADGPLKLRMCRPGELAGVAIARYNHIGPYDWMATPILQFLYATDRIDQIPDHATQQSVDALREEYRRRYLGNLFPAGAADAKNSDEWWESTGVAYSRRLWGYRVDTTRAQDEALVEGLNSSPNVHAYHLKNANCADFAEDIVNFYYPGAVHADHIIDFGIMSPKQVARSVSRYGRKHPAAHFSVTEVLQVPGSLRRSRPVRFGGESAILTKRYLAALLVIQPEVVVGLFAMYIDDGRFNMGRGATVVPPAAFVRQAESMKADAGAPQIASTDASSGYPETAHVTQPSRSSIFVNPFTATTVVAGHGVRHDQAQTTPAVKVLVAAHQ